MKISEFVKKYQTAFINAPETQTAAFIKKHITKTYIPYEVKIGKASDIIRFSMYKTVGDKQVFALCSPLKYVFFVQTVIDEYTDLEWDTNEDGTFNISAGFNMLEENDLTELIINAIGKDIDRLSTVINLAIDDEIRTNHSLVGFFENKADAISLAMSTLLDAIDSPIIKQKIESLISEGEK